MDVKILQNFGLTRVEAHVYIELSKIGTTPIGSLIQKTGLHRGTVYNTLNSLLRKGFVSFTDGEKRVYSATSEYAFSGFLEKEQFALDRKKKMIGEIKRFLEVTSKPSQSNIKVLTGIQSFKNFFNEMLDYCKKNREEYLFMGKGNEMVEVIGLPYYKSTQDKKRLMHIKTRAILSTQSRNKPFEKHMEAEARYMPYSYYSASSTWIYGNTICIVLWESTPIVLNMIKSDEVARSYRSFFEGLWESLKTKQKLIESVHNLSYLEFMEPAKESIDILGIGAVVPIHEGRIKIIDLLKKSKRVRILLCNPKSDAYKKRWLIENINLKDIKKSRMLHEWYASIANLKEIQFHCKGKLEFRIYDKPANYGMIIVDGEKSLHNIFNQEKNLRSIKETHIFEKSLDPEFEESLKIFEEYWNSAKPFKL